MGDENAITENLGIGGWFGDTAEGGASAICQTVCSPCMLCVAIILVFYGEYNYVKDMNNIYTINEDMVDSVTAYETANDGLPIAFFTNSITSTDITDPDFGNKVTSAIGVLRKGYMRIASVSTKTTNNQKTTTCTTTWSSGTGTQGTNTACSPGGTQSATYNNKNFRAPCGTGGCDADLTGSFTANGFSVNDAFLIDDYTGRTTASVPSTDSWNGTWSQWITTTSGTGAADTKWFNCGNFLANNYRSTHSNSCGSDGYQSTSGGERYDQSVTWEVYGIPSEGLTICSKQEAGGTFAALKSNGNYDIMIKGKKTQADCIEIMKDEATATVWMFRIIGFILFWCAFCMLFSIVSFLADRVGQLIPCGIGQGLEDMIQCAITIVTCPPACACWLFWFALAWLVFRPLIGGLVFVVSICLFGGMYYLYQQTKDPKAEEELSENEDGKVNAEMGDTQNQYAPQQQQQYDAAPAPAQQQQQGTGGFMNNMMNQANQYVNASPWAPNQQPQQAPPQMNTGMQDLNNDGIPDQYQNNLPPNFAAGVDPASNRVYWINYNTNPPSSQWNDPRGVVGPPTGY